MRDGDLFKGIVLRTRSTIRTPFPQGVYMRIKRYSDGQVLGVSNLTVWPDTANTDVVFSFPRSVELASSGNYYTLDFSETPEGDAVNFGMSAYSLPSGASNPDFYFIRSNIVPIATAQFYSWEELTGEDIAVSAEDTTKISDALEGKLDKSDGTATGTLTMDGTLVFHDISRLKTVQFGEFQISIFDNSTMTPIRFIPYTDIAINAGTGHTGHLASLDSNGNPVDSNIPSANMEFNDSKQSMRIGMSTQISSVKTRQLALGDYSTTTADGAIAIGVRKYSDNTPTQATA